jgi:hypothetical protein
VAGLFALDPEGTPGIVALVVGLVLLVGAVTAKRRTRKSGSGALRSRGSVGGDRAPGTAAIALGHGS